MQIRRLHTHERRLFSDHLKRLSPADRRFRFAHSSASDSWIDTYVAGIAEDDVILGVVDDQGRMQGAVHVGFGHGVAEIGVSVDESLRGQGLGFELFLRATRFARNRRAEKLYTLCLTDNQAMTALARKLGMVIHRECGTAEAYLDLDPPDVVTVSDELQAEMQTAISDWAGMVSSCGGLFLGSIRTLSDERQM